MVGRLPVTTALKPLDEEALLSILTKPRNALTKQYAKLFAEENVKLTFEEEALRATVKIARERKTGARALRSIFEKAMLDIMFEIPSQSDIIEVIVTADTITKGSKPKIITKDESAKKAS
jgi:ATP-dependent Clp protease ATP-binding subunit ClpX